MKKLIVISLSILFLCSVSSFANDKDSATTERQYNIIYLNAGALLFSGSVSAFYSINYERSISDIINIRAGYGLSGRGGFLGHGSSDENEGFLLMANTQMIINAKRDVNKRINLGLGFSFMNTEKVIYTGEYYVWKFYPSIDASYRYQPIDGGFFFSIGISYVYAVPAINFSLGSIF